MNFLSSMGIARRLLRRLHGHLSGPGRRGGLRLHQSRQRRRPGPRTTEMQRVPQLQRMAALELNVTRVSLQLRHAILSRTPQELAATLADVGRQAQAHRRRPLADYEKGLFTAEGKERFAKLPPLVARFWEVGDANIKLIQDGTEGRGLRLPRRQDHSRAQRGAGGAGRHGEVPGRRPARRPRRRSMRTRAPRCRSWSAWSSPRSPA